jgi:hypothetical protein
MLGPMVNEIDKEKGNTARRGIWTKAERVENIGIKKMKNVSTTRRASRTELGSRGPSVARTLRGHERYVDWRVWAIRMVG